MADPPRQVIQRLADGPKLLPVSMPAPEEVGVVLPSKDVRIPSPEEVGVASPNKGAAAKVDWNQTRDRLGRLGLIKLETVHQEDSRHRVVLVLRTRQADQVQNIEATAATEAEAVALALERAEQWAVSSGQ